MEKIVLDTNVYVSAILRGEVCEEVLHSGREGEYEIYVSPPILEELTNVLSHKFRWSSQQIAAVRPDHHRTAA